ncbi:hypothetical protein DPEC_G00021190 [Dallia pectoralis]|uniref:Uncharacterized protein n=1 Tax=Dallia pectoralis TaxID=75939 RepID=A0ACC2HH00_DALPE|nr:hypothetical protein DPEC_G00021190 [Dallia pectoralis]
MNALVIPVFIAMLQLCSTLDNLNIQIQTDLKNLSCHDFKLPDYQIPGKRMEKVPQVCLCKKTFAIRLKNLVDKVTTTTQHQPFLKRLQSNIHELANRNDAHTVST